MCLFAQIYSINQCNFCTRIARAHMNGSSLQTSPMDACMPGCFHGANWSENMFKCREQPGIDESLHRTAMCTRCPGRRQRTHRPSDEQVMIGSHSHTPKSSGRAQFVCCRPPKGHRRPCQKNLKLFMHRCFLSWILAYKSWLSMHLHSRSPGRHIGIK